MPLIKVCYMVTQYLVLKGLLNSIVYPWNNVSFTNAIAVVPG